MTAEEGLDFLAVEFPDRATDKAVVSTFDSFASKSRQLGSASISILCANELRWCSERSRCRHIETRLSL